MSCTYRYSSTVQRVENRFWFRKERNGVYTHLKIYPQYSGRVQHICGNNNCRLRITDLRESDSAEYKFRFITDQEGGRYTGEPGVTLTVTGKNFTSILLSSGFEYLYVCAHVFVCMCVCVDIQSKWRLLFLIHIFRSAGEGGQITCLSYWTLGTADVSQQVSSTWSSSLHLVQEWTDHSGRNIFLLFRLLHSYRQLFLCCSRAWELPLSSTVWVYLQSSTEITPGGAFWADLLYWTLTTFDLVVSLPISVSAASSVRVVAM